MHIASTCICPPPCVTRAESVCCLYCITGRAPCGVSYAPRSRRPAPRGVPGSQQCILALSRLKSTSFTGRCARPPAGYCACCCRPGARSGGRNRPRRRSPKRWEGPRPQLPRSHWPPTLCRHVLAGAVRVTRPPGRALEALARGGGRGVGSVPYGWGARRRRQVWRAAVPLVVAVLVRARPSSLCSPT